MLQLGKGVERPTGGEKEVLLLHESFTPLLGHTTYDLFQVPVDQITRQVMAGHDQLP